MDPVGAGGIDRAYLLAELGEVGGQDRRRDDERAMHLSLQINVRVTRHVRMGNAEEDGPAKLAGSCAAAADSRLFQTKACKKNRCFSQVSATAPVLHRRLRGEL
jgi:hypothetical protein